MIKIIWMTKKQFTLNTLLLLSFILVQCQEIISDEDISKEPVTMAMVLEQKELSLDAYEVEKIEKDVQAFIDTTSISDIKKNLKENYRYLLENKDEVIEQLTEYQKYEDDDFESKTRLYLPDEERFRESENTYQELVNDNHLHYRDTVQAGAYFDQVFKNNKSSLKNRVRNNGFSTYKFSTKETVQPYYYLNFDSEKELKIMNIYYHDGTVDSRETPIPEHSFPLNSIPVDKMKHIDSLQMEFKVMYVSEIDSVHFNKSEIGVKKGDFKLLKMYKNYLEYETPNDYYPYHKGSILEENYFNEEGALLDNEYAHGNIGLETVEEDYTYRLNLRRDYYEYVTIAETKEQVANALMYVQLKSHNAYLKETRKQRTVLKGNIESFTIYQEKRRDTITFLTTLVNANSVQNVYVHELEEETEFIDKNGKKITSISFPINFVYYSKESLYSDKFFYTEKDDNPEYYYLDNDNQTVTKLPYSNMQYLCKSIIRVSTNSPSDFKLISTESNTFLSDKVFNRFLILRYTEEGILVNNDEGAFLLLDQNNEVITPETEKVTKITLEKLSDF